MLSAQFSMDLPLLNGTALTKVRNIRYIINIGLLRSFIYFFCC